MKKLLLLFLFCTLLLQGMAQRPTAKGKITGDDGKPLAGASVTVKGTNRSAVTDSTGQFEVSTGNQANPVLVITYIGYVSREYAVSGTSDVSIQLQSENKALNDVIVVGYGTQRKRDVTGATSTVKAEEISKRPLVRVEQALQGTTPGVNVQSNSGQPGTGLSVRIRGANSITGSNDPLYVIDGYIGGNIESISPSDIESLEILKDASATAIYGSRGSNGVVLITTKSGKDGKMRVDFNPWFSKSEIPKKLKLMDAYDFANAVNAQYATTGQPAGFTDDQLRQLKATGGTDWQDAVLRKPWVQNYQLSVSGGAQNVHYLFSFNHLDQPGLLLNQYYKRTTLRANIDVKANDRLDLKFNITALLPNSRNNGYQGDITDPFAQAFQWDPTTPIRDSAGNYILKSKFGSNQINPVAQANNQLDDNSSTDVTGTGVLTYRILKGLTFTSNNTYEFNNGYGQSVFGPQTSLGLVGADYAETRASKSRTFQNSNFLTYQTRFGDHALTVTALYEQRKFTSMSSNARAVNLSTYSLGYYNLGLGATQKTTSGYVSDALQSYMGRVNYSYKDRYLLTASVRSDGSSHLTQKYSTFPSVALGWNVARESFMEKAGWISDLKLRASYGVTGNQAVAAYATIPQINSGTQGPNQTLGYYYDGSTLTIATSLGAPVAQSLKWENNKAVDLGLDAAFFKGRLTLAVDAYHKKITNLLYNYQAPFYLGGDTYARNIGSMENKGIEFAVGGTPVQGRNFKWTSNLTVSFNRNKVLNLGGLDSVVVNNIGSAQTGEAILIAGKSLGAFYGYQFQGTWKASEAAEAALFGMKPGDSKYTDVNGDHKYTSADLMNIGNGTPKYSFGFINDFTYGNFTLSVMFQGTHGNQIYSGTFPYTFGGLGDARNATNQDIMNVYTAKNETNIPTFATSSQNSINSSRYVYDASYVKLKNLLISYHLPEQLVKQIKMRNVEIYVSGQNLFTITHYPGYDPEVSNANYGQYPAITQGLETGVIPNPRTYTIGLRAGF
ncbi:SusC/RagA family TonB-linked outer membrane protein [Deminuibacter soli]|uniref:TonB-dependent receptor n=1 Tax=Deminuibacter soli TaxID=2291815 RepID=A0A3E1NKR9_9BACT|nr:TonB-dependent receptor [Deminuibacter soli]RFM28497.1 TonB-dependent receptor [Deminuibacter soli]